MERLPVCTTYPTKCDAGPSRPAFASDGGSAARVGGGLTRASPGGGGFDGDHRPRAHLHQLGAVSFGHELVEEGFAHAAVQAAEIGNGIRAHDVGVALGRAARLPLPAPLLTLLRPMLRLNSDAARGSGFDGGVVWAISVR